MRQEREALAAGRDASAELLNDMERLVEEVNADAVTVNAQSQSAAATGILVLVLLTMLSVAGAVLIGWLFVGRYLVRRLVGLAGSMRDMAGGDLEAPVTVSGNDEVTDMANALEVFRRYALEVQRLNLVEKLAQELDGKNKDLEHALERLHRAQEQIVAEEKLASLGQLAAGVAHEIKNPLNFVNNFTEVSVELIDEIGELLEESEHRDAGTVEEDQRDSRRPPGQPGQGPGTQQPRRRHRAQHAGALPGRGGRLAGDRSECAAQAVTGPRLSRHARREHGLQPEDAGKPRREHRHARSRPPGLEPRFPEHPDECLPGDRREAPVARRRLRTRTGDRQPPP